MTDFGSALGAALSLVIRLDPDLAEIVLPSLRVSVGAVLLATFIGMPCSATRGARRSREESLEHFEHFEHGVQTDDA